MRVFKQSNQRDSLSLIIERPFALVDRQGAPCVAIYGEEEKHIGCIKCVNPRCLFFSEDELSCDYIQGFPGDRNNEVCPVNAISWTGSSEYPTINNTLCFKCGVCVLRCPVGALYFTDSSELAINTDPGDYTETILINDENLAMQEEQIQSLLRVPRTGVLMNVSDQVFDEIYSKPFQLRSNIHNMVVRNLLLGLGCKCSIRRIGDVYSRMDAVYKSSAGSVGAIEVEFGRDTLDASRGILDDIGVLNTRYEIYKQNNKAIVVCLQLPNARQGYWQVIRDIQVVEGIKIGTVTVGALMMALWCSCDFEPENDLYYLDYDNMDLRRAICIQVDCEDIPLSEKKLGILEPMK